jgi:hypothetical protein
MRRRRFEGRKREGKSGNGNLDVGRRSTVIINEEWKVN